MRSFGAALVVLAGCTGLLDDAGGGPGSGEPDPDCVPMEDFFARDVYGRVIQPVCMGCHTQGGQAASTGLVFVTAGQSPDFLALDLALATDYARRRVPEQGDLPLLLLKPSATVPHGGGAVAPVGSDEYTILESFVARLDVVEQCRPPDAHEFLDGVEYATSSQLLRTLTISLAGRLPSAEEIEAVATGGDEALGAVLDDLFLEDAFHVRLREAWNDVFLTRGNSDPQDVIDRNVYPNWDYFEDIVDSTLRNTTRDGLRFGINEEPMALLSHIVRNGLPLTELLTADYVMVNPYSAIAYGVDGQLDFTDPTDRNEFQPVRLPAIGDYEVGGSTFPHAGVLTTYAWLYRHPTTDTNRNRHRTLKLYEHFLATNILDLAPRSGDPLDAEMYPNPVMEAPQCTVCHAVVDPVAGAFQNHDTNGRYRPRDWYTDVFAAGWDGAPLPEADTYAAVRWVAAQVASDPRFVEAMVGHAYRMMVGRPPLSLPIDPDSDTFLPRLRAFQAQRAEFARLGQVLIDSGYDLRALLKAIAMSPFYRARDVDPATMTPLREEELAELGSARLLTPEMLSRKIEAVFAKRWLNGTRDALTSRDEYLFAYGGIDSFDSTERLTSPNAVIASIARLMANTMACTSTAADLVKPRAERLLFPTVDRGELPGTGDVEARMLATIAYLHERFLGEAVAVDDPEVLATYALWTDVREVGLAEIAAGNETTSLLSLCRSGTITSDPDYTVRAWMAVVTYLASTYEFLYE